MVTSSQLLTGAASLPPEPALLVCGPLSLELDEGALRNVHLGNALILQRIYVALRDENWTTIPSEIRILSEEHSEDAVHIVFESVHQQGTIDFIWTGMVHVTSSQVTFEMDGLARSTFKRNRIGFCVLHDAGLSGHPCVVEYTNGTRTPGMFPDEIAPHQPYVNLRAIEHTAGGATISVRMEGDVFEMEDQRNWSDASYKTYCTDLSLPMPVEVQAGTKIQQKITVTISGFVEDSAPKSEIVITHTSTETPLPKLGLRLADRDVPLGETELEALRKLHLDHLRVELEPMREDFEAQLAHIRRISEALQLPLEIALWLNNVEADLQYVSGVFQQAPLTVARWLVFRRGEGVTSNDTLKQVRPLLAAFSDAPVYGGTDGIFTDLNRQRPDPSLVDGLVYSTNPQHHTFDNRALVETVETHGTLVTNARRLGENKPIAVGPITLKKRAQADANASKDDLPPSVDVRQMSVFAALWTLGSIKHNAQAEASSLTYFTTHGMEGVMDAEGGSPLPDTFPTVGGVFPVYWVLHELGTLIDAHVLHTNSTHPRLVDALDIRHTQGRLIFVVNYTTIPQTLMLEGIHGPYLERELSLETVRDPQTFQTQRFQIFRREGDLLMTLPAYTILILKGDT